MERRLVAILYADVVGCARPMGVDEAGTLAALRAHRTALLDPKAAQHRDRTTKLMDDRTLMEFPSLVEAVPFAVDVRCSYREPDIKGVKHQDSIETGATFGDPERLRLFTC
jgi:adenylate cyclase